MSRRSTHKSAKRSFAASPPFWRQPRTLYILGGASVIGGAYYVSHLETVPISGRRRFNDVSPEQERLMGEMAYQQMLGEYRDRILPSGHPATRFVQAVASRLIKHCDMPEMGWQVHVVNSPERNAFVLPGGKIFVFTGILEVTQDEDGMAAVLGHEIAHQIAHHSAEKLSWVKAVTFLDLLVRLVFMIDAGPLVRTFILDLGILRPFSRKCESEADYIGLQLMSKACFSPEAAATMWQRMSVVEQGSQPPQFLSTHPSHQSRITKIREWMPEAKQIREESCAQSESMLPHFWNFGR
eukprot:jgi/Hompol1/1039/HPOL_004097-RA